MLVQRPKFFPLFKNDNDINQGLSNDFINIFKKCKNPYIICMYGDARMGKSTKLNQIINGINDPNYYTLTQPFKTKLQLHTTETKGCNFYGPLKLQEITQKNDIDINEFNQNLKNSEFFLVDTEGLKAIDNTTKTFIAGILTLLQISSIKILYIPLLDNEKLDEIAKNSKLSNIIKSNNNNNNIILQGETIVLIRDIPLNEDKNENFMRDEINEQKEEFHTKINKYMNKIKGKSVLCEILPNFELAKNNVNNMNNCYKEQMQNLVYTIISNIKYNQNITGNKMIDLFKNFLEIFKEVKNIEILKNTENALNSILLNIFKNKMNKIYNNIKNSFLLINILHLENSINDIKNYLKEEIKKELNNVWDLYNEIIKNEIENELDKYSYELRNDIINFINHKKDEFDIVINNFLNFNKNIQLKNLASQYRFYEQINDTRELNLEIDKIIKSFIINNAGYIQCLRNKEKYKLNNLNKFLKDSIYNNIKFIINSRPKWKDYLKEKINEIKTNITTPFLNDIIQNNIFEQYKYYLVRNLSPLKEEVEAYINNNNYLIYDLNEFNDELDKIFKEIKDKINYKYTTQQKSIDDGIYFINPVNTDNKVLQFTSDILEISDCNNETFQKFEIKYDNNNKCYTIRFINTNEYLISGANNIIKAQRIDIKEQNWYIVLSNDNCFYEIISQNDGSLMSLQNGNNGSKALCAPKNPQLFQKFNFEPTDYPPPNQPQPEQENHP